MNRIGEAGDEGVCSLCFTRFVGVVSAMLLGCVRSNEETRNMARDLKD